MSLLNQLNEQNINLANENVRLDGIIKEINRDMVGTIEALTDARESARRWQALYESSDANWTKLFECSNGWQELYENEKQTSSDWMQKFQIVSKMVKVLQHDSNN